MQKQSPEEENPEETAPTLTKKPQGRVKGESAEAGSRSCWWQVASKRLNPEGANGGLNSPARDTEALRRKREDKRAP